VPPRARALVSLAAVLLASCAPSGAGGPGPTYDDAFWKHWGDGRAELAGYALRYVRYGEPRNGTAVAIFVTETFAADDRVKSEDPDRPESATYPVLKLNLAQDFPTGVYDYHLMTSAFLRLTAGGGRPAGEASKLTFSAQEWCGHVWEQAVLEDAVVRVTAHSYFDGEADVARALDRPRGDALAEDAVLVWARGLAAPVLAPGERREVALLRSLELARLAHVPVAWDRAVLARSDRARTVEVPAGTFEVDELTVAVEAVRTEATWPPGAGSRELPARTWTVLVERAAPHRVVAWHRSDGTSAELVGTDRLAYWTMNGPGFADAVRRLGLAPRPPLTP